MTNAHTSDEIALDAAKSGEISPNAHTSDEISRDAITTVTLAPHRPDYALDAVRRAGASIGTLGSDTRALIWTGDMHSADKTAEGLAAAVAQTPALEWLQLPSAGVDELWHLGIDLDGVTVTSAKGAFARPVAEHALTLTLAGLRLLNERIPARSWGRSAGETLFGAPVTIVGAGGIATELMRLLAPFDADITVVRPSGHPVAGAARTLPTSQLLEALADARVVVLAAPLTTESRGLFGPAEFDAMRSDAWLVNIARGALVQTDVLVNALVTRTIAGAAVDVTDPEPLPDGHPLWELENCIITPHTADTKPMIEPLLAARITENIRRFGAGEPLIGVVDQVLQY